MDARTERIQNLLNEWSKAHPDGSPDGAFDAGYRRAMEDAALREDSIFEQMMHSARTLRDHGDNCCAGAVECCAKTLDAWMGPDQGARQISALDDPYVRELMADHHSATVWGTAQKLREKAKEDIGDPLHMALDILGGKLQAIADLIRLELMEGQNPNSVVTMERAVEMALRALGVPEGE